MRYTIHELAGKSVSDQPLPGKQLAVVHAENSVAALDVYARREGFAGYTGTEMADQVTLWASGVASAPFTNHEIVAMPTRATSRVAELIAANAYPLQRVELEPREVDAVRFAIGETRERLRASIGELERQGFGEDALEALHGRFEQLTTALVKLPDEQPPCLVCGAYGDHDEGCVVRLAHAEGQDVAEAIAETSDDYRPIVNLKTGFESHAVGSLLIAEFVRLEPTGAVNRYRAPDGSEWMGCSDSIWRRVSDEIDELEQRRQARAAYAGRTNEQRAENGRLLSALALTGEETIDDDDLFTGLVDALANLCHFARRHELDWVHALESAQMHHESEAMHDWAEVPD